MNNTVGLNFGIHTRAKGPGLFLGAWFAAQRELFHLILMQPIADRWAKLHYTETLERAPRPERSTAEKHMNNTELIKATQLYYADAAYWGGVKKFASCSAAELMPLFPQISLLGRSITKATIPQPVEWILRNRLITLNNQTKINNVHESLNTFSRKKVLIVSRGSSSDRAKYCIARRCFHLQIITNFCAGDYFQQRGTSRGIDSNSNCN